MKVPVILAVLCLTIGYGHSCKCPKIPTNGCKSQYCKFVFISLLLFVISLFKQNHIKGLYRVDNIQSLCK